MKEKYFKKIFENHLTTNLLSGIMMPERDNETVVRQKEEKTMKLYHVYVDDGEQVFKTYAAAKNKKALLERDGGNGDFIKIEDVTMDHLCEGSAERLFDDLLRCCWGRAEATLIAELVRDHLAHRT